MLLLAQVDNLRTNHRGTFVLKDLSFRWLAKLSSNPLPPVIAPQNGSPPMHPAAGTASVLSIRLSAVMRPTAPCGNLQNVMPQNISSGLSHLGITC